MNKLGDEIMSRFDKLIGEFGNTAEILQAASKDLAADNQAAAAAEYGRTHRETLAREAELRDQIERLINRGTTMTGYVDLFYISVLEPWNEEVLRARKLIK